MTKPWVWAPKTEAKTTSSTRIFIVEDHDNFRSLLRISINLQPGMETCGTARSGAKALKRIPEAAPDLVLIDFSLPEMTGLELLDEMRARWPGIRCIILSGHSEKEHVRAAINRGANGYIRKASPKNILAAIEESLHTDQFISPDNLGW